MMKKKAIILADNRPALLGQMLIQIRETSKDVFDEAIIFDVGLSEKDKNIMQGIMPCRFIPYTSPLPENLLESTAFKRFSMIMFARYEMFRYLDEYSVLVWIDTDMVIQGSLDDLLEDTRGWGFSILCEDPANKSAKNTDCMRTNFFEPLTQYDMDAYLYCTGLIVIRDCLKQVCDYTAWCYEKTAEWAEQLKMPDQGVINALIQEFRIHVKPLGDHGKYGCFPYVGRDCGSAVLVHSWGTNKFWNNYYLNKKFPVWEEYYNEWVSLGGSKLVRGNVPEVSVVIPVYKPDLNYFGQCIDSLLAQMKTTWEEVYTNFEIIIVAEPFDEEAIIELIENFHDPRLSLVFNEKRLGIAASLNKGLRLAKGKYIARMDDDDIAVATRLARQAEYLNSHGEVALCTSDYVYFGDMNEGRNVFEGEMSRAWSILTCPFDHPTVMFRRDFFAENNLFYDETRGFVEDWELWQRAFQAGMKVGCVKEILLHHRWYNGSAGQNEHTIEMMDKMIQINFEKFGIQIPDGDCRLLSPWSGKVHTADEYRRLEGYFNVAQKKNETLKLYDDLCLKKVFSLRLKEAETGDTDELKLQPGGYIDGKDSGNGSMEKKGIKGVLKRLLKPIYQPFRRRYEERLINIQSTGWHIEEQISKCTEKLDSIIAYQQKQLDDMKKTMEWMCTQLKDLAEQVQAANERMDAWFMEARQSTDARIWKAEQALTESTDARIWKAEQNLTASTDARIWKAECLLRDEIVGHDQSGHILDETHRHIDFTYRDLMVALQQQRAFLPENEIKLETDHPIAYESLDHLYPHGTIRDNTRYPRFVEKCEGLLAPKTDLAFLDLGCSGGGMVLEAALRGHISMGLEGSDCSKKEQRAEWRLLGDRLQTCDITKPFCLRDSRGEMRQFDIITAWEVLEHIAEADLPGLFDNIKKHLADDGIFVGSIANWDDIDPESGVNWHVTVHPYDWWKAKFEAAGFCVCTELFDVIDLARGGYNPPHCYEAPYPEADTQKSFHIAVRKADA